MNHHRVWLRDELQRVWLRNNVGVASNYDDLMSMQTENTTIISVLVREDATPELEERFVLNLVSVETISGSISPGTGVARLDAMATSADITISASNNPHGQVDFQTSSLVVRVEEGQLLQLTVIRQFGIFGEDPGADWMCVGVYMCVGVWRVYMCL